MHKHRCTVGACVTVQNSQKCYIDVADTRCSVSGGVYITRFISYELKSNRQGQLSRSVQFRITSSPILPVPARAFCPPPLIFSTQAPLPVVATRENMKPRAAIVTLHGVGNCSSRCCERVKKRITSTPCMALDSLAVVTTSDFTTQLCSVHAARPNNRNSTRSVRRDRLPCRAAVSDVGPGPPGLGLRRHKIPALAARYVALVSTLSAQMQLINYML